MNYKDGAKLQKALSSRVQSKEKTQHKKAWKQNTKLPDKNEPCMLQKTVQTKKKLKYNTIHKKLKK